MAMPDPTPGRGGARSVGWLLAALLAIVVLIWAFWGFRWPPTAAVVEDEDEPPEMGRSVETPSAPSAWAGGIPRGPVPDRRA